MKKLSRVKYSLGSCYQTIVFSVCACALAGCESVSNAPAVTPAMTRGGSDQRILAEGRSLFVSRCIQCHALPEIPKYSAEHWREIIRTMSARANLSANDREAVLQYLLAARAL